MKSKTGFSLAELLVVIAIIMILTLIVFSLAGGAISSAHRSSCAQQLGQIGKALDLYVSDNNDYMPPYQTETTFRDVVGRKNLTVQVIGRPESWKKSLRSYVGSEDTFYCPADRHARTSQVLMSDVGERSNALTSYQVLLGSSWKTAADGSISLRKSESADGLPYLRDVVLRKLERNAGYPYATVHGEWISELFLDGRVKTIRLTSQ